MKQRIMISAAALGFALALSTSARADDPLNYPPFSWPSDHPAGPVKKPKKVSPGREKEDIYQNKNLQKQWYDGDFMGMDDD